MIELDEWDKRAALVEHLQWEFDERSDAIVRLYLSIALIEFFVGVERVKVHGTENDLIAANHLVYRLQTQFGLDRDTNEPLEVDEICDNCGDAYSVHVAVTGDWSAFDRVAIAPTQAPAMMGVVEFFRALRDRSIPSVPDEVREAFAELSDRLPDDSFLHSLAMKIERWMATLDTPRDQAREPYATDQMRRDTHRDEQDAAIVRVVRGQFDHAAVPLLRAKGLPNTAAMLECLSAALRGQP